MGERERETEHESERMTERERESASERATERGRDYMLCAQVAHDVLVVGQGAQEINFAPAMIHIRLDQIRAPAIIHIRLD